MDKLKKVQYISSHIGEEFTGIISGVTKWGIYVELENTVEGMIALNSIKDDYYSFDEEHYFLIGERSHRTFSLGEPLDVVVVKADVFDRTIDFELAEHLKDRRRKSSSGKKKAQKQSAKKKTKTKTGTWTAVRSKGKVKRKKHGGYKSQADRK